MAKRQKRVGRIDSGVSDRSTQKDSQNDVAGVGIAEAIDELFLVQIRPF